MAFNHSSGTSDPGVLVYLINHIYFYEFICSFIHILIHPSILHFLNPHIHPFTHACINLESFIYPFIKSFTYSPICLKIHLNIHLLTYSFINSLTPAIGNYLIIWLLKLKFLCIDDHQSWAWSPYSRLRLNLSPLTWSNMLVNTGPAV